ncbi:MAG: nuclear transport factor 2 family protein [Bacteroidota bacterium]
MKIFSHLPLILLGLCSSHLLAQTASSQVDPWITEFITHYHEVYQTSMLGEQPDLLKEFQAEEVYLMPEFQHTLIGRENVASYYQAYFNRFDIDTYESDIYELLDLGEKVFELSTFRLSITTETEAYTLRGKSVRIWMYAGEDRLTLETEAWNYNHSLDFAHALRFDLPNATHLALEAHVPIKDPISFEIAALHGLAEKVITQGNAEVWSQFYTDDGMFIYSFNPIHHKRKQLNAFFEQHVKDLPVFENLEIRAIKIEELDNGYVIEFASHIACWRNETASGVSTGKNIRIWRREPNGSLKTFRQIAMYN